MVDHSWRYLTGLPLARRSMITPNIYLGGQYGLRSVGRLKLLGVTAVVNMREKSIHKSLESRDFKILNLPTVNTYAPTMADLKKGAKFIEKEIKNGGKVYIHCWWGEERGPTMALAYLVWSGLTLDDAYKLVKKTRTFINPTPPQRKRLKEFEEMTLKKKMKQGILAPLAKKT